MQPTFTMLLAMMCAYLIGSISSAILVCKLMRLPDPRTEGSKNPGATNVLRIGGKKAAAITLLGDLLKGVLPVLVVKSLGFNINAQALIAFAAFIGHLYPVFFSFKGGKGVATSLGCILALSWPAGLCWIVTWMIVAAIFRYSSLSSLTASLLAPLYIYYFTQQWPSVFIFAAITIVLIIRHRSNIAKLIAGSEKKIGKK